MWNKIVVAVFVSGLKLHPYAKKNLSGKPQTKNQKETIFLHLDVSTFIDEIFSKSGTKRILCGLPDICCFFQLYSE